MLTDLPIEILLEISQNLEFEADFNALAQVNRAFYCLFNDELYRHLRQIVALHATDPFRGLAWAARNGNADSVRSLLNAGVPPDMTGVIDDHPMVVAAGEGHADVIRIFLEHHEVRDKPEKFASKFGPWQDRKDCEVGPFQWAFEVAAEQGNESVVKVLLEHLNFESLDHTYGHYFLDKAVHSCPASTVKLVLEMGYVRWDHDESDRACLESAATKDIQVFQLVFDAAPDSLLSDSGTQVLVLQDAIHS